MVYFYQYIWGEFLSAGAWIMTKQELKKLSRLDLVEMLLGLTKENEQLRSELEEARAQLADQTVAVEEAGTLAEATVRLNGVFETAEAAAEQYLLNIRQRCEEQERICVRKEQETLENCAQMEQETREKCGRMLRSAKEQVDHYLQHVNSRLAELSDEYTWQPITPDDTAEPRPRDE